MQHNRHSKREKDRERGEGKQLFGRRTIGYSLMLTSRASNEWNLRESFTDQMKQRGGLLIGTAGMLSLSPLSVA